MGNTPNVRFKGFTEDWEQRKFSELYARSSEKNDGSIGMDKNITVATMQFKNDVKVSSAEYLKTYYTFNVGDIAFEGHQSKEFRYGRFVENDIGNGIVSHIFAVFRPIQEYDLYFWKYAINNEALMQRILARSTKASTMMHDLVTNDFLNETFLVPSVDEQKQIGAFLNKLDRLITLHLQKCDETKEFKKYMLQNMFPQKDEKVPKIRFAGFTGDWEQRKFDDLADYKKGPFGSALKKDMFVPKSDMTVKVYEQQNAINKDWHLERYFITEEYANKLSGFRVEGGDIIVSCAGTIGETYEIPLDAEPGIINQALMRIKVKESIVNKKMFNILFTNMIDDFTRVHSNGSAIKNIPPFSDLKPMVVFVPKMDEQNKISSYFSNLDHLITLHQQKCNALKEFKKYMLQNMFPQKGKNKCQN